MAPVTLLSIVGPLPSVLGRTLGAIYVGVTVAAVQAYFHLTFASNIHCVR